MVGKTKHQHVHASCQWQATVKQHLHSNATPLTPPVLRLALPLLLDKVVQGHVDAPWHLLQGDAELN